MSKSELACIYAALLLADDDVDVTADKINTVLKAAHIKFVEPYLPGLFATALQGKNVKDMLSAVGSPGAAPPAAASAPAAVAPEATKASAKEVKKEESEADSDESMGFDLFG